MVSLGQNFKCRYIWFMTHKSNDAHNRKHLYCYYKHIALQAAQGCKFGCRLTPISCDLHYVVTTVTNDTNAKMVKIRKG